MRDDVRREVVEAEQRLVAPLRRDREGEPDGERRRGGDEGEAQRERES